MEASNERRVVRRLAPHLALPQQMLVPVHSRSGYLTISAGLFTYDRMARVSKEERNRMLSREETLELEPLLRAERIYGAGLYYEYLTDDARLVIECVKAAAGMGAVVANYAAVTNFTLEEGRLNGAVVRDETSGAEIPVRAKVIVNAAGAWVDDVRQLEGPGVQKRLHLTKGIHLILPRRRLDVQRCVVMNATDKRNVFVIPRGPIVYLGTTDTNYEGSFDEPPITREDARYLLDAANATFSIDPLTMEDIVGAWAGVRPLLHQEGKAPSEISRKDEVMISPAGLISIAGGKLTTFRKMAERITTLVMQNLRAQGDTISEKSGDEDSPLSGGDTGEDLNAFTNQLKQRWPRVPADIVERLVEVYGSNGERLVEAMANDPVLGERCAPGSPVTYSEVAYAVREEMALTLADFMERRSRLFLWDLHNGLEVASSVARVMGSLLGWDESRIATERHQYENHVADVKAFLLEPASEPMARAAHG